MSELKIKLPPKLIPVFLGEADTRGAYGGRGSAKTRSFAKMSAVRAHIWDQAGREGIILCGRQFMNSLDESSLEEVKAAIKSEPLLEPHFEIGEKYVRTKSKRIDYKFSGLDRNIASIKSKSRILLCWVDEAEKVTATAWTTLDPTLREDDSELWVTWNPEKKGSATDKRYRLTPANDRTKIVEMNWRDNPWFPPILERKRLKDLEERPEQYDHIWEGDYAKVTEGAYFASDLIKAKQEGRIGKVAADPLMTYRAFWDIGGTGAKADACAIWIAQWVGREIRVLDYYEAVGQPLATHVAWLRGRGYFDGAIACLPHDGDTNDRVHDVSFASALRQAGMEVEVIPNQGRGAARMRIEAARRIFPAIWFNEATTEAGRDALGAYHERRDDDRNIGLGPEHDWASHGADAFGLMCVAYGEGPSVKRPAPKPHFGALGWMG